MEKEYPRSSSKYASLFFTSRTISPQCTLSMFTGTNTKLNKPGLTFCNISSKHCRIKLLSPVLSQVIVCAGRQSKDSFKSHLRCNLEVAVSITVLPSFVIELHDKYVQIQLFIKSTKFPESGFWPPYTSKSAPVWSACW